MAITMSMRRNSSMPSSDAAITPKKARPSTWARDHASIAANSSAWATTSAFG
jgi:hypothetical protein